MKYQLRESLSKVPAVTLGFWIIKIAATTLGETGGDAGSATSWTSRSNGGMALSRYAASAVLAVFIVGCIALLPQRAARHPA